MTTSRVLPPEEWPALEATTLRDVWRTFTPENYRVCVVEEDGRIVAHWVAARWWHVEGIYTERPELFRRLWRVMAATLEGLSVRMVWTGAEADDDRIRGFLHRMHATLVPTDHFVVPVTRPEQETVCR